MNIDNANYIIFLFLSEKAYGMACNSCLLSPNLTLYTSAANFAASSFVHL